MRSEPVGWCGSVRTARPPADSTASAIARSPQATTTGPISAAMASGILAGQLVRPKELEKPVYLVAGAEPTASAPAEGTAAGPEPIGPLLAKADPKKGEQVAKVCAACHTFNKGGANKIGPNLWGITEEAMAEIPNYQFSAAMEAHKGEKWDAEKLNKALWSPQCKIKGTKKTFAGITHGQ